MLLLLLLLVAVVIVVVVVVFIISIISQRYALDVIGRGEREREKETK